MFDNVWMSASISAPEFVINRVNEPTLWCGVLFSPVYNKQGLITKYTGELKKLYITLCGDELLIKNSFHKYYHNENYSDFNYNDLKIVIDEICKRFKLYPSNFKIKRFEFGFNIKLSYDVSAFYNTIVGYKTTTIAPMINAAKEYGKKFILYDYEIKLYNKMYEQKDFNRRLHRENFLRVEIVYKHIKKAPMIYELSDMLDKQILEHLFDHFIADISQIEFIPNVFELKELTPRQRELVFAGSQPNFWQAEKSINWNTSKKKKQLYLNLSKGTAQSDFLIEKLTRKFAELIC